MKYFITIFILFLSFSISLIAESLENLVNRDEKDYPLSETIYWDGLSEPELTLLPDLPETEVIKERFLSYKPEITVQHLYRIKLPKVFLGSILDNKDLLFTAIINIFGKPETQVGYIYHSSTRDKDIELFEESYISNKKGKQIDGFSFTVETLPEEINYFQYIDEVNFKGTVSKQKIVVGDEVLSYQSTNIKSIWFIIIPIMKKGGTRNEIMFFTSGDYLFIYNCTQVLKQPAIKNLGFPIHLPSMFKKRMDVMTEWLEDHLPE